MNKRQEILEKTIEMVARSGVEGMSMRDLAKECSLAQSVIYHYFPSKDILVKSAFQCAQEIVNIDSKKLPMEGNLEKLLTARIIFHLDHAREFMMMTKYFLFYAIIDDNDSSQIFSSAYQHITDVLDISHHSGIRYKHMMNVDAKLIVHAINGYAMEFYSQLLNTEEKLKLSKTMCKFFIRALKNNDK